MACAIATLRNLLVSVFDLLMDRCAKEGANHKRKSGGNHTRKSGGISLPV